MGIGGRRLMTGLLALGLGASTAAADDAFAIKLQRPARTGDQFDVHLIFEQTRTQRVTALPAAVIVPAVLPASIAASKPAPASTAPASASAPAWAAVPASTPATATAPAPVVNSHSIKADLVCRVEVVDINFRGERAIWITINKFVSLPDGKDIVPPGKVIGLQYDGLDAYLAIRGGGDLSEDARTVLRHVHPLEYQLDEATFGSAAPRRAGESWNVNAASLAQMDSNVAFKVDPAKAQGKVTLVGAEKAGGESALRFAIDFSYSGQDRFRKSTGDMYDHQEFKSQIRTLLPQNAALPPLESQIVSDLHATGTRRLENGVKVDGSTLELDVHTSGKQTIAPITRSE